MSSASLSVGEVLPSASAKVFFGSEVAFVLAVEPVAADAAVGSAETDATTADGSAVVNAATDELLAVPLAAADLDRADAAVVEAGAAAGSAVTGALLS